jgi:hypothetical protein
MLKPGWLKERFEEVEREVKNWPAWMRKEAGLEEPRCAAAAKAQQEDTAEDRASKSATAGGD